MGGVADFYRILNEACYIVEVAGAFKEHASPRFSAH